VAARPRPGRTRRLGGIQLALGRPAVLLFPGRGLPLPRDGILARRGFDDHVGLPTRCVLVCADGLRDRLIKYDTFSEDVTKFYMAECILAIEAVHKLGFIHR
jgi:hypothetical protein